MYWKKLQDTLTVLGVTEANGICASIGCIVLIVMG